MLPSLSGFLDAGNAASVAVDHLLSDGAGRVVASFELDGFYDYRAMVEDTPISSSIVELRDATDRLLGACLTDRLSDGLSAG